MAFKRYQLNSRVIKDLKKRSTIGIAFYLALALLVLFADAYYQRYPEFSKGFFFGVTLICAFRFFHLFISRGTKGSLRILNDRIFLASVVITSLVWGVGFAKVLLQAGEAPTRFLMTVCTIGLCSGGVVAFIPNLGLSVVFLLCFLLPADVTLLFHGLDKPLSIAILLYVFYMIFVAARGNREYWDALENEHLLEVRSKELERISQVDGLTGLFNRRYFDEFFRREWNRALRHQEPLSVVMMDIDFFKQINDQYGHLAGDEYLRFISGIISRVFRRTTDITARYGGEEFVVVMSQSLEKSVKRVESIRYIIENEILLFDGHTIRSTISAGVATTIPTRGIIPDSLIAKADAALYQSKKNGRNQVTG